MAGRRLRILVFTLGTLAVVAASMAAGAVLFGLYSDVVARKICLDNTPREPTLLEVAQKKLGRSIYSQWNEETLIRHFFDDQRDGFFLDVGAAACCSDSTTYYLASRLGWTGIAIDANASYGPDYATKRPGTKFTSFFVSDKSDDVADLFVVEGVPALSSGDPAHNKKFPFVGERHLEISKQKIRTITLNKLLEANRVAKIDFLSMDIEGGELAALNGFDIEKYKPRLICIEFQKEQESQLLAYFAQHGYERIDAYLPFDHYNWYFRRVKSPKNDTVPGGG